MHKVTEHAHSGGRFGRLLAAGGASGGATPADPTPARVWPAPGRPRREPRSAPRWDVASWSMTEYDRRAASLNGGTPTPWGSYRRERLQSWRRPPAGGNSGVSVQSGAATPAALWQPTRFSSRATVGPSTNGLRWLRRLQGRLPLPRSPRRQTRAAWSFFSRVSTQPGCARMETFFSTSRWRRRRGRRSSRPALPL